MINFAAILTDLRAVIAAHAARNRALTVLLVAVWARIARMGTRLERLVALWRAGKRPLMRAPRAPRERVDAPRGKPRLQFPTTPGWLRQKLGYEVGAFGSQLQHLLTEAEAQAFLAAFPQAGRILRPLLHMLSGDPLPEVVRAQPKVRPVVAEATPLVAVAGVIVAQPSQFLDA